MQILDAAAPPAARKGFWTANILTVLGTVTIFASPLPGVIYTAVYLGIAWCIRRGQRWAAIAGVVFLATPLIVAALHLRETGGMAPGQAGGLLFSLLVTLICAFFLIRAARALPPRSGFRPWVALIAAVLIFWLCFRPMVMPTESMTATLLRGDEFVVETVTPHLGRAPQRGDVLAVRYPVDRRQIFVKRVVGIPGDRIHIDKKNLYVNGGQTAESYVSHNTNYIDSYRDNFPSAPNAPITPQAERMLRDNVREGEVVVPPGKYFVLGDNRDLSLDGRYWGFTSGEDIVGRPVLIYSSYALTGASTVPSVMNTRWNRLLKPLL